MSATCTANRPSTAPSASMTCHLRWSKFTLGKCVFISKPNKGTRNLSDGRLKSTGHFSWEWYSLKSEINVRHTYHVHRVHLQNLLRNCRDNHLQVQFGQDSVLNR